MRAGRDDAVAHRPLEHRQRGRRRGLAEDPLEPGETALRVEDRLVIDRRDHPLGLVAGIDRPLPRRRVADTDRRRDRLRVVDRVPQDERRGARCLTADHARQPARSPVAVLLAEAAPVRGDVAGVADRKREHVGGVAELLDDLERRGLLARRCGSG